MMETQKPIRVIIAEDHVIFRDGLRLLMENNPVVEFAGEAVNGQKLLEQVKIHKPDVVLTDLCMAGHGWGGSHTKN